MAPRKGDSDGGPREAVAPQPSTTSGTERNTVKIELDRADAERLLQALLGELVIDKQKVNEFAQKHWTASERDRIARGSNAAAKNEPQSR